MLLVLGAGVVAVLAWRLQRMRLSPVWAVGAPSLLGLAAAASLAGWLRLRWMSRQGGAAYLDRVLGLKQRLITAEEFAHAATPPPLYPLLIEDVTHRVIAQGVRFPKPWDRTAAALAALLLVLLLWPLRGGSVLQQLAQLPRTTPPSPPPEMPPPPEGDRQQPGASQRQQQGSSGDQGQSSQQGQGPSSEQEQSTGSSGQGRPQDESGSQSANQQSGDARSHGDREDQRGDSGRTGDRPGGERGQGERADASKAGSSRQEGQEGQEGQGDQGADGARERAAGQGQSAQPGGAQQDQGAASASAEAPSGSGGGQSSADQAALRAEIQELLQEVSGELKQLQSQLAEAHGDAAPSPGTSTDPELYEAPAPLGPDAESGSALPMSLGTDAAETASTRPGGGVGEPSDDVSFEAPGAQAEEAQLSDAPLEEATAGRQVVPPEYREVFDRLHRNQPSERIP